MSIDMLRQQRRKKQMQKWLTWSMMAEAFFIALSPALATLALMVGLMLTAWKVRTMKDVRFRHLPFDLPVALFVILGAASIIVSPDKGFSFYNYYNLVGVYVLTYLFIGQNVTTKEQVKKIVLALGASAAVVVLYGFYQYVFGIDISEMRWVDGEAFPELTTRVFSTWENPNILAGYLDAVLCVLLGFFMKCGNKTQKVVLVLGMVLAAACLAMTYARGACLAVAIVFLVYGLLKDWRIFFACLVAGGVLLLADSALYGRLASVFTSMDTSSEMRLAFWEATVAMIQDHPFLGIGWGAYWMVYPEYDFYMQGAPIKIVHAHNIYLNYMAEIGIAGAVAFFWYFFGTMRLCLGAKILPEKKDFPETSLESPFLKPVEVKESGTFLTVVRGEPEATEYGKGSEEESRKEESESSPAEIEPAEAAKKETEEGTEPVPEEASGAEEEEQGAVPEDSEKDEAAEESPLGEEMDCKDKDETVEGSREELEEKTEDKTESKTVEAETEEAGEESTEEAEEAERLEDKPEDTDPADTEKEETGESEEEAAEDKDEKEADDEKENDDELKEEEVEETSQEVQEDAEIVEKPGTLEAELAGEAEAREEDTGSEPKAFLEFKSPEEYWEEIRSWEDIRLRAGLSLGIGLAFVSVALNGLTDDLLFNIPTSMLFWFLAALGAVNAGFDEEKT